MKVYYGTKKRPGRGWLKFAVLGAAFLVAAGYLFFSGMKSSMVFYMTLEEFSKTPPRVGGGVRLGGWVKEGSVSGSPLEEGITFLMTDGARELPVYFRGQVPDTFNDGSEVIVEGIFRRQPVFEAAAVLAKCPSKYGTEGPAENQGVNR